jgi:acyl-CoA synthetase (AMP-forming)/AMP-acid ligase II
MSRQRTLARTVRYPLRHARAADGDAAVDSGVAAACGIDLSTQADRRPPSRSQCRALDLRRVPGRSRRLATAMRSLGVRQGDRVGTFCWNHGRHLHAYYGIPASGAVLHTLNIRPHPDELAYIVNHADDSVLIVDKVLWPLA